MDKIIPIADLGRLRQENIRLTAEVERLSELVHEAEISRRNASGLNDLLRMQFNDLLGTIEGWRASLTDVEVNILEMKHRLPKTAD
jgi:hypothetical protein